MRHSSCCYHVSSFMNRANETIVRFATCVLAVAMICVPTSLRAADTGRLARVRQADGTIRFVNDAYCRYYGRTREELLGRRFNDFTATLPADRTRDEVHLASLTPDSPSRACSREPGEVTVVRPDLR